LGGIALGPGCAVVADCRRVSFSFRSSCVVAGLNKCMVFVASREGGTDGRRGDRPVRYVPWAALSFSGTDRLAWC